MKTLIKILCAVLLVFNGAGAVYGGGSLILFPDGSQLQLSLHWLEKTPFHDYLIPGLILFTFNGFSSIAIFIALLLKVKGIHWWIVAQGCILMGWIVIQIFMIRTVNSLHIIMGSTGLLLAAFGFGLKRMEEVTDTINKTND